MENKKFMQVAIKAVVDYFNTRVDATDRKKITEDDVFIVWMCKTLGITRLCCPPLFLMACTTNLPGMVRRARVTSTHTRSGRT